MARYYFTRRAFLDLEDIYQFSIENWGLRIAQTYMEELFKEFQNIADNLEKGKQRQHRSFPFYMAPVEKHFAIYEPQVSNIIIATVIHSKRDIETLIKKLGPELSEEIKQIRQQIENDTKTNQVN